MQTADALRQWFRDCPAFDGKKINMDYMSGRTAEYAIYMSPTQIQSYTDITGELIVRPIQTLNFVIASRSSYSADALQNLANIGFFDTVIDWIYEQNASGNMPTIDNGTVISIVPTLSQYLMEANADSGRYQIQCKLTYRRK